MIRIIAAAAAALALVTGATTPASATTGALTTDQLTVLACTQLPDAPATPLLNPPDCSPATVNADAGPRSSERLRPYSRT